MVFRGIAMGGNSALFPSFLGRKERKTIWKKSWNQWVEISKLQVGGFGSDMWVQRGAGGEAPGSKDGGGPTDPGEELSKPINQRGAAQNTVGFNVIKRK